MSVRAVSLFVLVGCTELSGTKSLETYDAVRLDDPAAWSLGDPADDPLGDHRPLGSGCPVAAWGPEDDALEIQTGVCTYAWLVQPLVESLPAGRVSGLVWFADLDAARPASAHVALSLDDDVFWEAWVDIPHNAAVLPVEALVAHTVPEGARLGLHLHNHGFNSWKVAQLTLEP